MVKKKNETKSNRRSKPLTLSSRLSKCVASSTSGNIQVIVRVRPTSEREQSDNFRTVVDVLDKQNLVFDPKEELEGFFNQVTQQPTWDVIKRANKNIKYNFDHVYGNETANIDIYNTSVKPLIDTLISGYNCSVFAYGATGSGKTYTMIGSEQDPGITFLTINNIFKHKENMSSECDFEILMSYLEVYNETVKDLLNPGPVLQLRENGKYGVFVAGLEVHRIKDYEKLFELLEKGNKNRTQHPTDANSESSRSHAVFQIYLKMTMKVTREVRMAKLSMIDLAGSEKGAATGYTGARFTEGANINKSLLALGNCINGLAEGLRHIPYRDSKLTRLLKDSLGGNCRTVMISNISPSSLSYEDTYNTLKYATRAKKIKSNMIKNVVNCEGNLNYYKKLVEDLTKQKEELTKRNEQLIEQNEFLTKQHESVNLSIASKDRPQCQVASTASTSRPRSVLLNNESQLRQLYANKRELQVQICQFESMEQQVAVRKRLKEECNSRLSGICTENSEKTKGHKRLGNAIHRLDLQADTFKRDIIDMSGKLSKVEDQIKALLEKVPELQTVADIEESQSMTSKADQRGDHFEKMYNLMHKELKMYGNLVEQLCLVSKSCYMQLRGFGHTTEDLRKKYNALIQQVQGIRSVTWDDENAIEMGSSSSPKSVVSASNPELHRAKNNSGDMKEVEIFVDTKVTQDLDKTFVLPTSRPKVVLSEQQINNKVTNLKSINSSSDVSLKRVAHSKQPLAAKHVIKLYKSPSNKRLASVRNKENIETKNIRSRPHTTRTLLH